MSNRQLRRHETLPNLTAQDDLGTPDSRHDGLGLPHHPTDIADPRIFMLSEAIKQTLSSSFTGIQSTLTDISTQMERIASRPSPFHAHRANDRISLRTPTSTRARVSPLLVPLLRQTVPRRPPANLGGGGGRSSRSQGKHTPGR